LPAGISPSVVGLVFEDGKFGSLKRMPIFLYREVRDTVIESRAEVMKYFTNDNRPSQLGNLASEAEGGHLPSWFRIDVLPDLISLTGKKAAISRSRVSVCSSARSILAIALSNNGMADSTDDQ
jgi:hypothetical protein